MADDDRMTKKMGRSVIDRGFEEILIVMLTPLIPP